MHRSTICTLASAAVGAGYTLVGRYVALRGPGSRWEPTLAGQNPPAKDVTIGVFNQPNNVGDGLNNPATGGAILRCTLTDPRTVAVATKQRFQP